MSAGSGLSHSRTARPLVSKTTPWPVRSLTSRLAPPPRGATAIGVASRALVNTLATRSVPSNATIRLESGSGAQEWPPMLAAGERPRKRRVRLGAASWQAASAAASSAAPSARAISGRGCDRLDLDRVQPADVAMNAHDLHLAFGEIDQLRVLRVAGLRAHRQVGRAVAAEDREGDARLGARLGALLVPGPGGAHRRVTVHVDHLTGDRHLVAAAGGRLSLRGQRQRETGEHGSRGQDSLQHRSILL